MGNCKCIENFDFLNELNLKSEEKEEYSKPKHKTTLRSNRTIEEKKKRNIGKGSHT